MPYGFVDPKVGTLKVKVPTNSDTYIAQATGTAVGQAFFKVDGVKFDIEDYDDAKKVLDAFAGGIAGTTYDSDTTTLSYTAKVEEKLSPALNLSEDDVTVTAGNSTTVTVARAGTGALSLTTTTAVEGITADLTDNTITITNSTATSGEAEFLISSAETNEYGAGTATLLVSASE